MAFAATLPRLAHHGWRPTVVRLTSRDGMTPVDAGAHPDYPGLAVHRTLSCHGRLPDHVTITHVASGHAVIQGIRRTQVPRLLPELLADLAAAGDWTQSAAAIHADVPMRTRMQRAIEAGYKLLGHSVELNRANGVAVSAREATP